MKTIYKLAIVLLLTIVVWLEIRIYDGLFGDTLKFNYMLQTAGLFIALGSGIIALSSADRKPKKIKVDIQVSIADEKPTAHDLSNAPQNITDFYKITDNLLPEVYSYKVIFKITNKSKFTLTKPVLAFRLPIENKHPDSSFDIKTRTDNWKLDYHSNIFNTLKDVRGLEFRDSVIISNSNLDFWNDSEEWEIWFRMCLDKISIKPVKVTVSVNSENAEGITKEVEIPNKLIP